MKSEKPETLPKTPGVFISYGAFELKRCYQKHLGLAVIIAGALHLAISGGFLLYSSITSKDHEIKVVRIISIANLGPPPSISQTQPGKNGGSGIGGTGTEGGTPKGVPDEEAPPDSVPPPPSPPKGSDWGDGDSVVIVETPEEEPKIVLASFRPITAYPGDTLNFFVGLKLASKSPAYDVSCLLTRDHPYTNILQDSWYLSELNPGPLAVWNSQSPFEITFGAHVPLPAHRKVRFKLNVNVRQPQYSCTLDVGPLTLRRKPKPQEELEQEVEWLARWKLIPQIQDLRTGRKIDTCHIGPNINFQPTSITITYEGQVYEIKYVYPKFPGEIDEKFPIQMILKLPDILPDSQKLIMEFFLQECKKCNL